MSSLIEQLKQKVSQNILQIIKTYEKKENKPGREILQIPYDQTIAKMIIEIFYIIFYMLFNSSKAENRYAFKDAENQAVL